MKYNYAKQQGITAIGFVLIIGMIAFFTAIGVKLVPLYIEYFEVKSILKTVQGEPETATRSAAEIEDTIMKRLSINNVQHVTKDDITISREGKKITIDISYEARVPLAGDIDLVGDFKDNKVEVTVP